MPISLGNEVLFAERTTGDGVFPFDRLMGTDRVRQAIDAGAGAEEIVRSFEKDVQAFAEMRKPYLLYE